MQVSDVEQLMRSTLRAADILCRLRGMASVGIDGIDIDVAAWLLRADAIELLGEQAHRDVARAFFIEMLSHATKSALFDGTDDQAPQVGGEVTERARRAVSRTRPDQQAIVMPDGIFIPERLMTDYHLFVARLHPLVFVAARDPPLHRGLCYKLALVVHSGHRLISTKQAILRGLDQLRQLRKVHAASLGGADCHARLFLIVWRDEFHPLQGKQTTVLRTCIAEIAKQVAREHLTIEAHNVIELQYDATTNERVPKHMPVDRASEPGIATIADAELPTLLLDDVQVRLYDFAPGQIVRIERKDLELGYDDTCYKIVRPAPTK